MNLTRSCIAFALLPALLWSCQSTENRSIRAVELPAPPPVPMNPDDAGPPPAASSLAGSVQETQDDSLPVQPMAQGEDEWRLVFTPYAWALSLDGSANIAGQDSIIDESFSDIWDNLNVVVEGRFEGWKGRWAALLDFTYAEIEDDSEAGGIDINATTDMGLVFAGGMYRILDQEPIEGRGGLKVDGLVGIAYTSMKVDLDLSGGLSGINEKKDWVDPIVGLRSSFQFSEKWGALLESVIGGFDLTDGSDLVTMNTALMTRKFGQNKALHFGWRTLGIDYDNDKSGSDKFKLNVHMNGPIVGFSFSF